MAKIIKKIIRYFIVLIALLFIIASLSFILFRAPKFQTYVVSWLTENVSQKLGTNISVGKVSYTFFRKIVLYDVLIEDLNRDTLLHARHVSMRIKEFRPSDRTFSFGRAEIYEPDFRMVSDSAGIMNLSWYISKLKSEGERDTTKSLNINFSEIEMFNGAYSLSNVLDTIGVQPGRVNVRDMRISSIDGQVHDLTINADSVSMIIRQLSFRESGGFTGEKVNMTLSVRDDGLFFREIDIRTDSSSILADRVLILKTDSAGYSDFLNKVKLDIILKESLLNIHDLAYFVKPVAGLSQDVIISGMVSGPVAEMKGRDITIEYATSTRVEFDFDVSGLPAINDSYLFIDFTSLSTRGDDIERIILPGNRPVRLPVIAHDLGLISFTGSFTGFTTDFVAFGTLTTERGSVSTDLSLRPDGKNLFRFNGLLNASDVDLAYVTRNNELFGGLWLHANIDGSMQSFKHLSANISGVIDSVEINDYLYRNVAVEGKYSDRVWDGNIAVRDQNIRMDILGRFDLGQTLPEFDFTMNLANAGLHRLNLVTSDTLFRASALITATFKGNNIDNLDGDLRLINSTLENSNGKISIYDFLIRSEKNEGVPLLSLRSDFADAEVRGEHTFAALGIAAKSILAGLFPSKFALPAATPAGENMSNQFSFNARIKNIDKLNEFFSTGVSIASGSTLSGFFSDSTSDFRADFRSDALEAFGNRLKKMSVMSSVSDGRMSISLLADTLFLPERSKLVNFSLSATSRPDTVDLGILWDNNDGGRTLGEIKATGYYCFNEMRRPYMTIDVLPSSLTVDNSPWKINPAKIVIDSAATTFKSLMVNSGNNFIRLDGRLSSSPQDRLELSFEGLNLDFLNNRKRPSGKKDSGSPSMTFGGRLKGSIAVSDAFDKVLFESDINVSDFTVNNNLYGTVTVLSEWNPQRKVAVINIKNDFQGSKFFDITGIYNPSSQTADITAQTFRMPLNVINPLVSSFASDVRGVGSGKARLYGKLKHLILEGSVLAEDASLKVDFLQARYSFSDSIRFTRKGIDFRNIRIYDEKMNQGMLNGSLTYDSFKNLGINFDIRAEKMLVLNTRPKDNDTFYGTAYATGYAGIKGTPDKIAIIMSGRTEDNTSFYVPLSSSEVVSEYPYIIMTDPKKEEENTQAKENIFIKEPEGSNIELHFDLEVTPEAEVQILIDPKAGDVIRGTGEGKLNITMDRKGDVKMAGNYVIEDGDYLFTLGNILNKRFSIEEGGTITWNGGIEDAELNIKAVYRLKASLYDIYPEEEFRERIPVECQLILTEKLMNPVIGFNIDLPTANDDVKQYLNMAINTEEELSRQFLYLLVMNSFYPDPALYSASSQSSAQGAAALGVTTTEMLTNQVSNWLSQISNDFDIGLNYRPGNDITPQEVEVALSTQLLNDKVIVNGNFDVSGKESNASASTISGDFNIEFKITEKLRFKVFNRANNDIFYETAPYTQGFGIFFRRDFDRFEDLFILPDNRKKKAAPDAGEPKGQ
jgi:hypothetical protein